MDPQQSEVLQACPSCSSMIDVSAQEPFEQVPCPVCKAPMRARTQFNHFTLVDVLGSGGMGAVYRALDRTLNRFVALKVVRREYSSEPEHLAQFEKEARITAAVNHPNVVKVFSYGQDHGSFYIAMELVNKGSLDELMASQKQVPEATVLQIGIQIAQGLKAAQQLGLIHRDIKPGNILFAEGNTAKIVDFGLATIMEKDASSRGELLWGTPYYVAPERLKREPEDFRSDIYSLGASLFHAISGKPPFTATSASVSELREIKSRPVSLLSVAPGVSSPTAVVIDRMLKEHPEERFESYDELIELLTYASNQLAAENPLKAARAAAAGMNEQQQRSSWLRVAAVGVLLAAGAFAFSYFNPPAKRSAVAVVPPDRQTERLLARYDAGRNALVTGNFEAAESSFATVVNAPCTKPLLFRWALFQLGITQFLEGKPEEGRSSFAQLARAGVFSEEPEERQLAEFLVEIGKQGACPEPMRQVKAAKLNEFQALLVLVEGLKLHANGKTDQARVVIEGFQKTVPEESFQPYLLLGECRDACKQLQKSINEKSLQPSMEPPPEGAEPAGANFRPAGRRP